MTIKSYLAIIISIFILGCNSTNKLHSTCSKYKKGKFKLNSIIDDSYSIITRNDSLQLEVNSKTGATLTARIFWNGPCTYNLHYLNESTPSNDSLDNFINAGVLKIQILKATSSYYVFEATMEGVSIKYSDTIRVLKH